MVMCRVFLEKMVWMHFHHCSKLELCRRFVRLSPPLSVLSASSPWPLRGVVAAVWQLRSGAGALALLEQVDRRAGKQAGRQAQLQFDGRRKAGPKGTAARKRLELHWGCLVGEWHPLEWRRRAVCGDVRRRKNLVNLTKRLRNSARTVGRRRERDAKDALFARGTHIDGF